MLRLEDISPWETFTTQCDRFAKLKDVHTNPIIEQQRKTRQLFYNPTTKEKVLKPPFSKKTFTENNYSGHTENGGALSAGKKLDYPITSPSINMSPKTKSNSPTIHGHSENQTFIIVKPKDQRCQAVQNHKPKKFSRKKATKIEELGSEFLNIDCLSKLGSVHKTKLKHALLCYYTRAKQIPRLSYLKENLHLFQERKHSVELRQSFQKKLPKLY